MSNKIIRGVVAVVLASGLLLSACLLEWIPNKTMKEFFITHIKERNASDNNINELILKAKQGDMKSQSELGFLYENGKGVEKNYSQAVYWYKKASDQGYAIAQYNLGASYENGRGVDKNDQQAREWYRQAAENGVIEAQVNLGMMYLNGAGGVQDYTKSLYWLMKAAKKNNTIAMNNLGYIYSSGIGTQPNHDEAIKWYAKSAQIGSMKARNMLALYYLQEIGDLPLDKNKAIKLLNESACQGYPVAQNNLGILYSNANSGLPLNYLYAYAWFSVAFYNGSKDANNSKKEIEKNLTSKELEQGELLAREYIKKYPTPADENDTSKGGTECTNMMPEWK